MALPQEKRYTLADVLTWEGEERVELIDGVPVMMAPPVRIHQEISGELFAQLHAYLKGKKCRIYAAPFAVRLFERQGDCLEDVGTMVEPDIAVVCDPSKLDDIGCKGAPDLVIEILSPSTRRHDKVTKFNLYRLAGVREYWMVDPVEKAIQSFVLENGVYVAQDLKIAGERMNVHILEGCVIDLSEVFL